MQQNAYQPEFRRPSSLLLQFVLLLHLLLLSRCSLPEGWSVDYMVRCDSGWFQIIITMRGASYSVQSDDVVVFNTGDGFRSLYFHNNGKASSSRHPCSFPFCFQVLAPSALLKTAG
jgi:hypothetical protein